MSKSVGCVYLILECDPNPSPGLSLITNMAIVEHDSDKEPPTHSEVMETGKIRALDMQKLVKNFVYKLN